MTALRAVLAKWRRLALVLACALLLPRLLVPAGFMPVAERGQVSIVPCSGFGPMAMPGGHHHREEGKADPAPCPFAALAQGATGGTPALLLTAALAFILSLAFTAPPALAPRATDRLRPPLRAPPA